jgi:hypothetical protein
MTKGIKELDAQEEENSLLHRGLSGANSIASGDAKANPHRIPFSKGEFDGENASSNSTGFASEHDEADDVVPMSELRKVRFEAAKYRKQLRQLEQKSGEEQKASELAKMKEVDRLKGIAAEAEARAAELKRRADFVAKHAAVINVASALGFYNPEDASRIIDLEQIEIDNDGNVDAEKINEIVGALAESKPYLIKERTEIQNMAGFGPTNPPSANWPKPKERTQGKIERLKQQAGEFMRTGRMSAAIKLYNQAWEKERGIQKPKGG